VSVAERLAALVTGLFTKGAPTAALTATRWAHIQDLLSAALERVPEERRAFLAEACGEDGDLRREVESLLAAHERGGRFDRLADALHAAPAAPLDQTLAAGTALAHYRVREVLGGGGMGVVYLAHDTRLDRTVALKFLSRHLSLDPVAKQRFLMEAQTAASLDHPNICTIHEIGEAADGRLYIVMPHYRGEPLSARLARGPLPLDEALEIALQTARGLAKAHDRGIVHRDVKPGNLMITEEGVVKMLDFGIAKMADVSLTDPGQVVGTVGYMSPEQAAGDPVDHRSDLWSVGVVLYEMVAGRRPFEGDQPQTVIAEILTADPTPPALPGPGSSAANRLIARLLAKAPSQRFATAAALIPALEDAVALARGEPPPWGSTDAALAPDLIAPDGERRQISVLAGRLAGYPALLERLPPEELEGRLARVREAAGEIVARHEGTVNQFGQGEFVCFFGVPITHEDDCVRAVRAGLEVMRWLGAMGENFGGEEPLGLQAGIGTGLCVVQPARRPDRAYAVAGHALDSAALLVSHAGAGEILLAPGCVRLVAPFVETEPARPLTLPDRAEPLVVHRVLRESGVTTRFEAATGSALSTFSGREPELAALGARLDEAAAGRGQLVTVVGEAGLGKSRLIHEFTGSLAGRDVRVIRGRCPLHGAGRPYHPLVEALRDAFDLAALGAALDGDAVASWIQSKRPTLEDFIPLYLDLLSAPSERHPMPSHLQGKHLRSAMNEALLSALTADLGGLPVVLALEDWHWTDDASHEALEYLATLAPQYPLLVVVTYRPGYGVAWAEASQPSSLQLRPLDLEASARVVQSVLRADAVPGETALAIHERAGGNPFFVEELCHTLLEQGLVTVAGGHAVLGGSLDELHLPETVEGVIRTRLDRLDVDTREVMRVASVVGREFSQSVLERAVGEQASVECALPRLIEPGLVQRVRTVPEPLYCFRHVLTREVAYETLLQHQRRGLHARVGAALEVVHAGDLEQHADLLARHFGHAEDWRRAVRYGRQAARQAAELSEFARALEMLERVEAWATKLPTDVERDTGLVDTLLDQERLCETLGLRTRQQEIIARLVALLEPRGDRDRLAEVCRRQGDLYTLRKRFDDADVVLQRALALSTERANQAVQRNTLTSLGLLCWHGGRLRDGLTYLERALEIDRARGEKSQIAQDLHNLAAILRALGEHQRALVALEEALTLAEEAGDPLTTGHVLANMSQVYRRIGDLEGALAHMRRAENVTRVHRLLIELPFILTSIAHLLLERGQVDESLALYREAIAIGRRSRNADALAQSLGIAGDVLAGLDRHGEAVPCLGEAAALFAQLERPDSESRMRTRAAELLERLGRHQEAAAEWAAVRDLAHTLKDTRLEVSALEGLARVARDGRGDLAAAGAALDQALASAAPLDDAALEARLCNAAGIVAWRRGAFADALALYERTLELCRERDDPAGTGLALNSLAVTLVRLDRRDDAYARLEEAAAFNRASGERLLEAHAQAALGDLHCDDGRLGDAERCYRRSLRIRRAIADRRGEGWMLVRLARVAGARNDGAAASRRREQAHRIAELIADPELLRACGSAAAGVSGGTEAGLPKEA
jgi:serine/threonine protein kinase/predicted ATPase